ncbi:MAG: heparinase II/III family protein [Firmicutes bacterium]|nr:heparinase II/III family protein [Bacillota bacterium]
MTGLGIKKTLKKAVYSLQSAWEYGKCTYAIGYSGDTLNRFLSGMSDFHLPAEDARVYALLSSYYLQHRFDVLGSGWVQVKHGMHCRGVEGYRYDKGSHVRADAGAEWLKGRVSPGNLHQSRQIWQLIQGDYTPIDWQLDVKSGYRWDENTWFKLVPVSPAKGADIKVPWELSRMQHLPHLAIACALARRGEAGFEPAEVYAREFRNQVLDFMATNPPRYGVNWYCSMDVAIRVVNWLVAYDLFSACGTVFDDEFKLLLSRGVHEHFWHILHHLEWSPRYRNNHYLANIAGLLFCAAYLPSTPLTDAVLAFAVQELITEVDYQFHADGSNFEASTCYHRLSAEIVMWCTALVLGLPAEKREALSRYDHRLVRRLKPAPMPLYPAGDGEHTHPFPEWYADRVHRMARFTWRITKPNGQVAQIGDNDSGRFIKLQAAWRVMTVKEAKEHTLTLRDFEELPDSAPHIYEDTLDHSHLLGFACGLFGDEAFEPYAKRCPLEWAVSTVLSLYRLPVPVGREEEKARAGKLEVWEAFRKKAEQTPQRKEHRFKTTGGGLRSGLRLCMFADFGVYLFRSSGLYLLVRCGRQKSGQRWGHAHNDQMHIELWMDGRDIIRDPGTYLYGALPEMRNRYRSIHAHFTPAWQGKEPGRLSKRVFEHVDSFHAECLYFGEEGILVRHTGFGFPIHRMITIGDEEVICIDLAEDVSGKSGFDFTYARNRLNFSPGYGVVLDEPAVLEEALL